MFGLLYLIGWGVTATLVVKLWTRRHGRRSRLLAVLLGIVAGAFWPITLWVAGGVWWYRRQPADDASPGSSSRTRRRSAVGVVAVCSVGSILTTAAIGAAAPPPPPSTTVSSPTAAAPAATATVPTTTTAPTSPTPSPASEAVTVSQVIDGDTVELTDRRIVRLLGINAPERDPVACWSAEATRFARDTLTGRTVQLLLDPTQDEIDRYGRTLAYLELSDSSSYSVLAAQAGAAFAYTYDTPVQLAPQINTAQAEARTARRGVWGPPCFGIDGPLPTTQPFAPPPASPRPAPAPKPAPAPARAPAPPPEPKRDCEPGYSPCVPSYPPDLDCGDLDGPYLVTGSDPHRLDGNNDGEGCE